LSCAISAHRQFCHDFAAAVKEREGVRLAHPPIFSHHPGYDISAYYAQAMVRREQISEQGSDDMPTNSIILAVPKSFGRVLTDFEPEPTVKFVVYNHPGDMADQLDKLPISAAVAIERHLQCGGTLDCFPAPFEKLRQDLWEQMCRVPRKADQCFHGWQVQVFLEQLRDAASNTLRLPRFKLKERKPKEAPNKATTSATATGNHDDDEPAAKKRKLPKRPEVMYLRDPKAKRAEHAPTNLHYFKILCRTVNS
uniref:TAFII55_N domain-containing protein n=1 Tax=Heligmosomoides polygyrus TaxID=6339 RepID=A0A183GJ37_HELPZ